MIIMDLQLWNTDLSINSSGAEEDKRGCLIKRFLRLIYQTSSNLCRNTK